MESCHMLKERVTKEGERVGCFGDRWRGEGKEGGGRCVRWRKRGSVDVLEKLISKCAK